MRLKLKSIHPEANKQPISSEPIIIEKVIEKPIYIERRVEVPAKESPVQILEKIIEVPVEKIVEVEKVIEKEVFVEVPKFIEKTVVEFKERRIEIPVIKEVLIEKPIEVIREKIVSFIPKHIYLLLGTQTLVILYLLLK